MRIGLFCFYPDEASDSHGAIQAQTSLIRHAEEMGFDEAWIAEHHFDAHAVSPSILVLLGYLAGVTTRLRIGSAAILLPFRNPIQVAEDVATIDSLSGGRFNFGVAKGGPFPGQNEHFGIDRGCSRRALLESLSLVERLLYESDVSFSGEFFRADHVTITPRPVQAAVPTWIASMSEDGVRFAASRNLGVMATLLAAPEKLRSIVETYHDAAPHGDPRLAVARFFHTASTRAQAREEAWPQVCAFADRMRANMAELAPDEPNNFSGELLMARSLIGSHDDVRAQICSLHDQAPITSLMLKPAVTATALARRSLDAFMDHVKPNLPKT